MGQSLASISQPLRLQPQHVLMERVMREVVLKKLDQPAKGMF